MNVQQLIEKNLQNSNNSAAFELYERQPIPLSWKVTMQLAKAYFIQQDYQKVLRVLSEFNPDTFPRAYEYKMLQLKSEYLLGMPVNKTISEVQFVVSKDAVFQPHHKNAISEVCEVLSAKEPSKTKMDLQAEGEAFEQMYKRDENKGAFSYEGFPIFLVSRAWFMRWRVYVFLESDHLEHCSPGPITQFQLLDHPFNILYDNDKQKDYTNRYLLEGVEYELLTKECWQFLQKRYGGIPISRLNIALYEKPSQTVTEVYLKKVLVARYDRPQDKFWVQICRKETWQGLARKIQQNWGKGRLWKFGKTAKTKVNLAAILEDEDLSSAEIIYEVPVNGLWQIGEAQQQHPKSNTVQQACAQCGKTEKLRYCSCRLVKYCDMKCLQENRYKHRKVCESRKQQQQQVNNLLSKFNLSNNEIFAGNKGLVGLRNLGNTCYMNTGIQCLSNTREFTEYFMTNRFLKDINSNNPLGSGGHIACCYSKLIREMWAGKQSDVSPWELKKVISYFAPQFSGYGQHDSQQLISTLLDALHEDTNIIKVKPSVEIEDDDNRTDEEGSRLGFEGYAKRNKSFISDLTCGQFKSTAKCPCGRVSKSFDPFMLVNLPIPQPSQIYVFLVNKNNTQLPIKLSMIVTGGDTVQDVAQKISQLYEIKWGNLRFYGIDNKFKIANEFRPTQRADTLRNPYYAFAYEIDLGPNEDMVKIQYLVEDRGDLFPSYPRFLTLPHSYLTLQTATQLILKDVPKYARSERTVITKDMFDISITNGCIRVVVKPKADLLLQTHRTHRDDIEIRRQGEIDLSDCLNLFQREERLDKDNSWYCNKCKQFVQALKKIEIYRANRILMLGLKRFRLGRKLKCKVSFPISGLDLGPYIIGNTDRKPVLYDLYAVANHYGTMLGGHYTAFCKNFITGKWYEFNDHQVSKISEEDAVSSSAYVLFYRKRE